MRQVRKWVGGAVAASVLAFAAGQVKAAVEIEYWQYFFEARLDAMTILIDNFEKANPDITVKMSHFPYAAIGLRSLRQFRQVKVLMWFSFIMVG